MKSSFSSLYAPWRSCESPTIICVYTGSLSSSSSSVTTSAENVDDLKDEVQVSFQDAAITHGNLGKRICELENQAMNLEALLLLLRRPLQADHVQSYSVLCNTLIQSSSRLILQAGRNLSFCLLSIYSNKANRYGTQRIPRCIMPWRILMLSKHPVADLPDSI